MLIRCPECNREISDKSEKCIHCGFPLKNVRQNICIINNVEYDMTDVLKMILSDNNKTNILIQIRQKCNLQLADAINLYDVILTEKKIPSNWSISNNIPHCPTCGSTNIKSIYEIFSSWDPKQFKCNNCGYKW